MQRTQKNQRKNIITTAAKKQDKKHHKTILKIYPNPYYQGLKKKAS
jgi:hypothetical protein